MPSAEESTFGKNLRVAADVSPCSSPTRSSLSFLNISFVGACFGWQLVGYGMALRRQSSVGTGIDIMLMTVLRLHMEKTLGTW